MVHTLLLAAAQLQPDLKAGLQSIGAGIAYGAAAMFWGQLAVFAYALFATVRAYR